MIGKVVSFFHEPGRKIVHSYGAITATASDSQNRFVRILYSSLVVLLCPLFFLLFMVNRGRWLGMIENTECVSKNPFICKLWTFIFEEVKRRSGNAETLKRARDERGRSEDLEGRPERSEDLENYEEKYQEEVRWICEARGDLFLERFLERFAREIEGGKFLEYLTKTSYDNSILAWHIATEIWYNVEGTVEDQTLVDKREFSKILSDYMLYLLFNQPKVMSAVANVAQFTSHEMIEQIYRCWRGPASRRRAFQCGSYRAKNEEQLRREDPLGYRARIVARLCRDDGMNYIAEQQDHIDRIVEQLWGDDGMDHGAKNVEQLCESMIRHGLGLSMIEDELLSSKNKDESTMKWRSPLGMGIRLAGEMACLGDRK